ncbi:hypothetical protein [Kamptonema formosum]|uniref:hypothetical protein n=1 Tax=Kamptonema formosum TaxID=331992 RepID=UPI000346C10A|nr:hypothetical protein [Oscillatoria sp. PCC 10802]
MTKTEILEALKQLTAEDRLEIIEVASRLMREEIEQKAKLEAEGKLSLAAAADLMRPYYEPGSELTALNDLSTENFYEYEDYA